MEMRFEKDEIGEFVEEKAAEIDRFPAKMSRRNVRVCDTFAVNENSRKI